MCTAGDDQLWQEDTEVEGEEEPTETPNWDIDERMAQEEWDKLFGLDDDDTDIFKRTVDWGIENAITTATYHILTPYPGTRLFEKMERLVKGEKQ